MQPCVALPRIDVANVRHQTTQQKIEGLRTRGPLLDVSRHLPKNWSIRVVMWAVEGLSGVIACMNALWRGRSQRGTHEGPIRPAVQRSSLLISISVITALTDLVSCSAPADLFTEAGKGRVAMRATSFNPRVTYARRTEASCLASAAASAVAIVVVQA